MVWYSHVYNALGYDVCSLGWYTWMGMLGWYQGYTHMIHTWVLGCTIHRDDAQVDILMGYTQVLCVWYIGVSDDVYRHLDSAFDMLGVTWVWTHGNSAYYWIMLMLGYGYIHMLGDDRNMYFYHGFTLRSHWRWMLVMLDKVLGLHEWVMTHIYTPGYNACRCLDRYMCVIQVCGYGTHMDGWMYMGIWYMLGWVYTQVNACMGMIYVYGHAMYVWYRWMYTCTWIRPMKTLG
jgi:hypothetical protein